MEKKIAHYPLADVRSLVEKGFVRVTRTALMNADSLGFGFYDIIEIVRNLEAGDLYKSMTSHHDQTIWQDVYHFPEEELDIYLKIQIDGDLVVVSFKEL